MNRRCKIKIMVSILVCVGLGSGCGLKPAGTPTEARAMLEKAITALKANPIEAIAAFNKPDGGFRDRDLYVFCFTMETGKYTATVFPELMNTDVRDLIDNEGNQYGSKIYDAAKEGQVTTVSYKALKPGGTYAVPKVSYVTRVADQGCGVGYYQY